MTEQRKDKKGRVLKTGESQRKDGRYAYKYTDSSGRTQYLYSWTLLPTDHSPKGKEETLSLREKIERLEKNLRDGIFGNAEITVIELVEKYISQKTGVSHNTRANYKFVVNIIRKERFGRQKIESVHLSDAKGWLIKLQADGRGYSTIHCIRGVVRPAFQMAVDDDILRKNPFAFELATVVVNDSVTRCAVSHRQERAFLEFVEHDRHFNRYYEGIYLLFKAGMRISEFAGLTVSSLDMKKRTIRIDCQLQRTRDMRYVIEPPKTACGNRTIPMTEDVYQCLKRLLARREKPKVEPMVDGRCGFLYLDKNGQPMVAMHWEHFFQRICDKYNRIYKEEMPKVTPHVCRHTYCSNMAKAGMNPKTLQYLMGHADIGVTMNTYTHLKFEDVKEEMKRLEMT